MEKFYPVLKDFGLPVLILLGVGWFFIYKVWPYITEKDKRRDALVDSTIRELAEVIRGSSKISERVDDHLGQLTKAQEATTRELIAEIRASRK